MNEYAAVIGTLAGVLVGGLTNFLTTRSVKQQEWRLTLARDQLTYRQQTYSDFLAESQRLTALVIYGNLDLPSDLKVLDKLIAQMSLVSPPEVVDCAWELRRHLFRGATPSPEALHDRPSYEQLSEAFLGAAQADLKRQRGEA